MQLIAKWKEQVYISEKSWAEGFVVWTNKGPITVFCTLVFATKSPLFIRNWNQHGHTFILHPTSSVRARHLSLVLGLMLVTV